jgi:signal transduction histidine kinase
MDANQTKVYTAIIITGLFFGSILILFIISLLYQQRRNSRLFREKILAEITTLENERTRMAADLHDELGPLLFSIKFKLTGLEPKQAEQVILEDANSYIDDAIQRIRDITNNLMPGTLTRKGVIFAIEEYIDAVSKNDGLKIVFTHNNLPGLEDAKAVNIYRLVLEIIHNTLKHANAGKLHIDINATNKNIHIKTTDDGKGFDYQVSTPGRTGLGLRNMLNRTEVMDGDMYIETKPGEGTTITIEIPNAQPQP